MKSLNALEDWSILYAPKQLKEWQLPEVGRTQAAKQKSLEDGIFRELFLSWRDLPQKTPSGHDTPLWFLCCDVLDISKDIMIETTALVFARRIEVAEGAAIVCDRTEGNSPDIVIFAQEVVDKATGQPAALNLVTIGDDEVMHHGAFQPDPAQLGASGFVWSAQAETPESMSAAELEAAYFYEGEPLRLALTSLFQVATLLSTEKPALSISQFRWIASLAQASAETRDLAAQASAMAITMASIQAANGSALLVPQLDLDIYAERAAAFMTLLQQRSDQWDEFQSRLLVGQNWSNAAKDAIATRQNEKDLIDKLLAQAENTRTQAVYARDIAAKQIVTEKALVTERKIDFDFGIAAWKKDKTIDASVKLVLGVVKIFSQIPAIVAAGPQMAVMPAVEGAAGLAEVALNVGSQIMSSGTKLPKEIEMQTLGPYGKAVAKPKVDREKQAALITKETQKERKQAQASLTEGFKTAGGGGKEVFDAAMSIVNIAQTAEQMEQQSRALLDSVSDSTATAFATYEVQGLDVVTGGEQEWDSLLLAIENTFEQISVLSEVSGGTAYRLEIRRLVIYGKALSQARLAMAQANAQLAEMKWRRIAAENAIAIAKNRLKQLADQTAFDEMFAQLIFGRLLDAKRSIYLAMEAYRRAFQYFALVDEAQSLQLPRITASVDEFDLAIAKISGKELKLQALSQQPQSMKRNVVVDSPDLLEQLKSKGLVTWELEPDNSAFNSFGRVRFNVVRVFAEGLTTAADIKVEMATSGLYTDKVPGGSTRRFASKAMRRNFVYTNQGEALKILFDGDIAPRYEDDFFAPTPFTIWTLKIESQAGQPIDLSSVTKIRMEFQGEATSIFGNALK